MIEPDDCDRRGGFDARAELRWHTSDDPRRYEQLLRLLFDECAADRARKEEAAEKSAAS